VLGEALDNVARYGCVRSGCVVGKCCRALLVFGAVVHMRASGWTAVRIGALSKSDPNPVYPNQSMNDTRTIAYFYGILIGDRTIYISLDH
jgi:hypothetical protein